MSDTDPRRRQIDYRAGGLPGVDDSTVPQPVPIPRTEPEARATVRLMNEAAALLREVRVATDD